MSLSSGIVRNHSFVTVIELRLSDEDLERIADAVAARLGTPRGWLDVSAASDYTSLTREAIRTAVKRGKLQAHKGDSGRLVFRVEDLDAFMSNPE